MPQTFWKTEHYDDAPSLAGKPGVGLVLDPGRSVALREVHVTTTTPGFVALIKGGDSPTSFTKDVSASQTVPGARASPSRAGRSATTSSGSRVSGLASSTPGQRSHRSLSAFRSETLRTDSPRRWPRVLLRSGKSSGSTVSRARGRTGTSLTQLAARRRRAEGRPRQEIDRPGRPRPRVARVGADREDVARRGADVLAPVDVALCDGTVDDGEVERPDRIVRGEDGLDRPLVRVEVRPGAELVDRRLVRAVHEEALLDLVMEEPPLRLRQAVVDNPALWCARRAARRTPHDRRLRATGWRTTISRHGFQNRRSRQ